MHRRDVIIRSGIVGTAALSGLSVAFPAQAVERVAAAHTFKVGDATVTAFSDGYLPIGPEALSGVTADEYAALLKKAYIDDPQHLTGVNAFLVETGGRKILIDTGTGALFGPALGHLADHMAAVGVAPEQIDTVIATHLHPDHIGGCLSDGRVPFSKAGLLVSADDLDFWRNPDMKAAAPDNVRQFFDLAMAVVAGFRDRIQVVRGEAPLGPGLTAIPLPGHTPGHMGVMLESAGESLFFWADIVHVPAVQLARPEVTIGFDIDQDMARATRMRLLDLVVTNRQAIAGAHIAFPGAGHIERAQTGFRFVPMRWQYG